MVHARSRLIGAAASLATAVAFAAVLAVPLSASAQTCPYNSTQGTCACPTSGSGTTCFGGQLYRSTDSTCQTDTRPCSANQQFSCSSVSCTCNTAAYPCGGCTAASSTVGATCSAPTGGQYTNVCGVCACPAGTTLCAAGNRCVANRACAAGTTWDPCTDTCGTPNVLLSPGTGQNGFIDVAGDWRNRAGNFRLDFSNGAGVGDLYMASGKSLRIDGLGVTNLNIANYGAGGTGLNVNLPTGTQMCFGATCRSSWPSTADFNPTYVNAGGDSMTGLLTLNGGLLMSSGAGAGRVLTSDASGNATWTALNFDPVYLNVAGDSMTGRLTLNGGLTMASGAGAGRVLTSDASGNATWQTLSGLTGSGTANRIPKFTSSSALGDSTASDTGTGISIAGTASSGAYGLSVANVGTGGGIDVSTNSSFNGIPALRVTNSGAGRGLEVMGGTGGNAAFIRGAGDNVALEAANYNYSGTSTLGTIMQIRRGTGAGIAPAAGMGGVIGFPLQSDSAGSYTAGPALGGAIQSLTPWKTALVFIPSTYAGMVEKMRLTTEGYLGIGTSTPTATLQANGSVLFNSGSLGAPMTGGGSRFEWVPNKAAIRAGDVQGSQPGDWDDANIGSYSSAFGQNPKASGMAATALGYYTQATNAANNGLGAFAAGLFSIASNQGAVATGQSATASGQAAFAHGYGPTASGQYSIALGDRDTATNNTSIAIGAQVDATGYYGIGIGNYAAATNTGSIIIGGGIDVSRKMTNSTGSSVGIGYGSTIPTLLVTSAPNTAGTYGKVGIGTQSPANMLDVGGDVALSGKHAFRSSDSWLRLNQDGAFASGTHTPGNFAPGALNVGGANGWGNPGGGNAWIAGTITVYGGETLGGTYRSSWPTLATTTTYCQFNAGSGAGWKACYCPGGYDVTGWYGYNCKNNGGDWECSSSAPYGSNAVQVYHDSATTAYVWAQCARVN